MTGVSNENASGSRGQETAAPSQPSLSHRLAAVLISTLIRAVGFLPLWISYPLADLCSVPLMIMSLVHERKVSRRGRGMFRNQRIVYRDRLTSALRRRLFVRWARHMTRLLVDFCRIPRLTLANLAAHVDTSDCEKLRACYEEGRGVICVTGHLGHWELCSHVSSLLGIPSMVAFRPLPSAPLTEVVTRVRTSAGQTVFAKEGVLREIKKALDRGDIIGIAGDENARGSAVFVPFLGTLAATYASPAILHLRTGAPIVVVSCNRRGRGLFRFHVWKVLRHEKTADRKSDIESICHNINDALSKAILTYPEQWLWTMRRFHSRPAGEIPGPDGLPPRAQITEKDDSPTKQPPNVTAAGRPGAS